METRKKIFGAECLFTALIAVYEVVTVLALFTDLFSGITIKQNILFSQSLIFVPTVLYLFIMRKHVKDIIWFRRFHPLTLLLIPPLVLFMEPLITLLNAISMLFVRNEISNAASALVDHNTLGTSLFFMAFLPCVIEELAYRGVMFGSFHEAGRLKAILMSGILFGLMHMNFNQIAYAVVIGLIFGFVVEATGSIIPTMIMHFLINGFSVVIKHIANIKTRRLIKLLSNTDNISAFMRKAPRTKTSLLNKYGVNAQINENKELVLPTNNVADLNRVLEFLNEDIFRGVITDRLYRSNSKKKDNH